MKNHLNPTRHPKKKSEETWEHLEHFWGANPSAQRPNILFIAVDDLRPELAGGIVISRQRKTA